MIVSFPFSKTSYDGSGIEPASLVKALQDLETADTGALTAITTPVNIVSNSVYPSDQTLVFVGQGALSPSSGVTVTLNCKIIAAPGANIFDISKGGTFNGNPLNDRVYSTWFGADPTGVNDSVAAMQAWLTFCSGKQKPIPAQVPGHYKLVGPTSSHSNPLLTVDSYANNGGGFGLPMIEGVQRGGNPSTDYNCWWDASGSHQILYTEMFSNIAPPIIAFTGGSGEMNYGGIRDVQFTGNGQNSYVRVQDAEGVQVERCTGINGYWAVEVFARNPGGPPTAGGYNSGATGGFPEWNLVRDCRFAVGRHGIVYRRWCAADYSAAANGSLHGNRVERTWINLPAADGACAVYIYPGEKLYNGFFDIEVFFHSGSTQYAIGFEPSIDGRMNAIPPTIDGCLRAEGALGLCKWGGPNNYIAWLGRETSLGGISYGSLVPCYYANWLGSEAGASNGVLVMSRRPYSTVLGVNSGTTIVHIAGSAFISVTFQAANYEYRIVGSAWSNNYGNAGNWTAWTVWAVANGTGWGPPTISVDSNGNVVATNASWPASTVSCYVQVIEGLLSPQAYSSNFNVMYPY